MILLSKKRVKLEAEQANVKSKGVVGEASPFIGFEHSLKGYKCRCEFHFLFSSLPNLDTILIKKVLTIFFFSSQAFLPYYDLTRFFKKLKKIPNLNFLLPSHPHSIRFGSHPSHLHWHPFHLCSNLKKCAALPTTLAVFTLADSAIGFSFFPFFT